MNISSNQVHSDRPFCSFIIPVYNAGMYLEECLYSIQNQGDNEWEAILVDDGSTDSSADICDRFADADNRFKVIHKSNGGVSSARNIGLENSSGEWIWFVDADDSIEPESLSKLRIFISENECDTVFHGLVLISERGDMDRPTLSSETYLDRDSFLDSHYAYQNGMVLFSNDIVRMNDIRFCTDTRIGEDLEFQYNYLDCCRRPVALGEALYDYYCRAGSAMLNPDTDSRRMEDSMRIASRLLDSGFVGVSSPSWKRSRFRMLIKSGLQAAAMVSGSKRDRFMSEFKEVYRRLKKFGDIRVIDRTLMLAYYLPQLYFRLIRSRLDVGRSDNIVV